MWSPQWLRSPSRVQRPKSSRPQAFSCSSFKDIQTLLQEEQQPEPESEFGLLSPRRASIFHRVRISSSVLRLWAHHRNPAPHIPPLPDGDQRVVIFYTSLRVVRKTFEDCRAVRSILRGFRVPIDERDVSMDAQSLDELQGIVGTKSLNLPMVFIGGRFVGGADEIRQLHECGELKRLIQGLPVVDLTSCDSCGGLRFVVCDECDGSHKVYTGGKCGFRTCLACNENGLLRCPSCSPIRIRRNCKQT
ncbi:Thioredoxin-like fold containing protein [Parasponia andersonii]|uniref:Thioredoxin-like fold containing protein n=1 Tax=Parasponia andersonii TaxID=3476 RepID=A0A2P5BRK0_PARAD|nr:Thioredoxin-like fold containing protein [Parasponia andersonii]